MACGKLELLSISIFLGFIFGVLSECPNPVFIKPCTCTRNRYPVTVKCSNFYDMTVLEEVFDRSDRPFTAFILERSNLMYLPSAAIHRKEVSQIVIANSTLMGIFDKALEPQNTVSHLTLLNTTFQRGLQWAHFKPLNHLLDFTAEYTEVRKLDSYFERNITPHLEKLQLIATKTRFISDTAFRNLTALKTIAIQQTKISVLKRSMFPEVNNAFIFDFSHNRIQSLPDDLFKNTPRISEVMFVGNRLRTFSEATFGNIMDTTAMLINLKDNLIACDCTFRWFLYKERYVHVRGVCDTPVDKKGKGFRELRRKEFDYCPK